LRRELAPLADLTAIERLHPARYVEAVRAATPTHDLIWLDPDTVMSPHSWEAALRATGAAVHAVDQVMSGAVKNAFCAVRPPGHHAEPSRPMGFCLFNTVAIAALHARAAHGAERVAVIDFDVHHGNGTQDAFWSDKDLFYGSTHQMPLFPGTGALSETGVGNICNSPLRAGDGRELVDSDFTWVTEKLLEMAEKHAGGRVVSTLEGGYNLEALGRSTAAHVEVLMQAAS